ncbi:MAG: hypothetical protein R6U89_10740 [Dehalococcoidia bacterium]
MDHLLWISTTSSSWGAYFEQTADIDASDTSGWNIGAGFSPIGGGGTDQKFDGVYDGGGHVISNLTINRPNTVNVGLFGHIGESGSGDGVEIKNLVLTNVDIKGARGTGSLVGRVTGDENTFITRCTASNGTVIGNGATGGLVGSNNSYVETPSDRNHHPTIQYSYANVSVSWSTIGAGDKIGGLAGCNQKGKIYYSHARGSVTVDNSGEQTEPTPQRVGGLAGCILIRGYIINSYSAGNVSTAGTVNDVGGFVGSGGGGGSNGDTENCFWDTETSGQSSSSPGSGCTGKTTTQMQTQSTFTDTATEGLDESWDFTNTWEMNEDVTYPLLQGVEGQPPIPEWPVIALFSSGLLLIAGFIVVRRNNIRGLLQRQAT